GLGEGFRSRHRGIVRRLWLCHDCRTGSTASRGCRRTELHPQLHRLHAGAHPVHQLSKVRGQFQRQLWGCKAGGFKAWRCKARRFEAALRSDLHEGFCLHRAISGHLAAQPLVARHWQTPVDLNPPGGGPLFVHYGSPVITAGSTILVPVTAADGSYQLRAFQGSNGAALYTLTSDYTAPANADWTPPSGPALALGTRAYYPGAGGTVYYRDLPNSANIALRPTSDIVALLVFTHQVRVMNLIAHPENVDELAAALTFADEAPLPGPIRGDSRFAEEFAASGPLRD